MAEYFQRTEEKMKRSVKKLFALSGALLTLFVLWTAAVCFIDVQPIGPDGSSVGLAALNAAFQKTLGVNMTLYEITDWLGIVPLCFVCGFALLGLVQLIKRKSFRRVDPDILVLGAFYTAVFAAYIGFEALSPNFRPVLIEGWLEASYPSSTTLLAMCVIPTAMMQLCRRIKHTGFRHFALCTLGAFCVFMPTARLISGVHWFSDIVGALLLSAGLATLYAAAVGCFKKRSK